MAERKGRGGAVDESPTSELTDELHHLFEVLTDRVLASAGDRLSGLTDKLTDLSDGGPGGKALGKAGEKAAEGKSPLMAGLSAGAEGLKSKVGQAFGGGGGKGGKGGKATKVTNIIEQIDIGAPVRVVYDQWTEFQEFSKFMKKVEGVDQKEEEKLSFKAQVLWSHRTWEATIVDQVPDQRIVWRSSGEKGHVDGAVTFHEIGPELTRVLVVLEYHPQGLFERTGNLWRAQGRRVRLELKHFRRHVMTQSMLHPDEIEGWRGEIHDSEVEVSDEEARENEADEDEGGEDEADEGEEAYEDEAGEDEAADEDEADEDEADEDEADEDDEAYEDEYEDEAEEAEPEEEEEEAEPEEEEEEPEAEDEEEESGEYEDEYDEDEEADDQDEPRAQSSRRRRRSSAGRR